MKTLYAVLAVLLFASLCQAQSLPVTFAWDASADGPGPATNPVLYRLCTTPTAPAGWGSTLPADRVIHDAGAVLELQVGMSVGVVYVFATARNLGLSVDGTPNPNIVQESGPSNVLRIEVFAPPGRPDKVRIKSVTQVQGTTSGQTMAYRSAE